MASVPLLDLIAGTLGVPLEQITGEFDMSNTKKWDSLRHVMLMTELETNYGIELSDKEMMETVSVAMIRALLQQRGVS